MKNKNFWAWLLPIGGALMIMAVLIWAVVLKFNHTLIVVGVWATATIVVAKLADKAK